MDGYFGPADLKAEVDLGQLRSPARLRDDAAELRARVAAEVADPVRRAWLEAQLVALETQAAGLAGESLPYLEYVGRCFAFTPPRRDDAEFDAAAARIDALLPGDGPLDVRLEAWDAGFEIAVERLPAVIDWLVGRFRDRAESLFGLPDGESLRVSLVRDQPWSGYDWYDGGRRSRVEINTDLPVRAPSLVHTIAHETYPGHHLEHAWKEAELVDRAGRLEASILLINTPECLISEGLADLGRDFAVPAGDEVDLLVELFDRAGLALAADPAAARAAAERSRRARRSTDRARGHPRERRDPPTRGRPVARLGPRLPPDRRSLLGADRAEAPRVHRASAVADVRVRLRRGGGAAAPMARCRARPRSARPGSAGCSASR